VTTKHPTVQLVEVLTWGDYKIAKLRRPPRQALPEVPETQQERADQYRGRKQRIQGKSTDKNIGAEHTSLNDCD
jgi:hypothetical protein